MYFSYRVNARFERNVHDMFINWTETLFHNLEVCESFGHEKHLLCYCSGTGWDFKVSKYTASCWVINTGTFTFITAIPHFLECLIKGVMEELPFAVKTLRVERCESKGSFQTFETLMDYVYMKSQMQMELPLVFSHRKQN